MAVEGLGHPLGRTPVELHGVVERNVEVLLLWQATLGVGVARRAAGEAQRAIVGGEGWHVLVGGTVDVGAEVDGAKGHRIFHSVAPPFSRADAVAGLLLPTGAAGVEVEAALIAVTCLLVLRQSHVLVAQQQPRFGIARVNVQRLGEQLDGFLVLANDALLHRLLEQGLALWSLPYRSQWQQHEQHQH